MARGYGARVLQVNVGTPRELEWHGKTIRTAIWKQGINGPVTLRGVNLAGDDQADRSVHGGEDKAVYAYAIEDYEFWAATETFAIHPGLLGENLTVQGLDLRGALVGERWRVGTALLEVAQPRLPCFKLGIRVGDPTFPKRFQAALLPGAYLRIVEQGTVQAGDSVRVTVRPNHEVTIGLMVDSLGDPSRASALLAASQLPAGWRAKALELSKRT